ncbi:molybdopterin-guanine dinucleotide biosynthesis protein B [Lentibacillus persicus]|nr:molybdopterin-guanine dinucleotide biosynthesis protein B [Lentibacillus persicus]
MQICQISGYKGSGKTALMTHLVRHFSEAGLKVGSLKHHGHGGEPAMQTGTDSQKHLAAGSVISGVQGETVSQLTFNTPFELDDLIRMYASLPLDLVLLEGYKQYHYPKIVLIRNAMDLSLLDELSNIIAAGSWDMTLLEERQYPVFEMKNMQNNISVIAEYIRRDANG